MIWHACKYKAHKLQKRYILKLKVIKIPVACYIPYISGTLGDAGMHRDKTEPIFYSRQDIVL